MPRRNSLGLSFHRQSATVAYPERVEGMITCRAAPSMRGLVLIYLTPQLDPL